MAVRTERSEVRTKTTEGQYSPVRLEQARLVSSLLYGTRVMLLLKLPAFENKKYTSYDHFHGNGPYGKIPTKKEPIRTPGFTPRLPCHIISSDIYPWTLSVPRFSEQIMWADKYPSIFSRQMETIIVGDYYYFFLISSVEKPDPKEFLWAITTDASNPMK